MNIILLKEGGYYYYYYYYYYYFNFFCAYTWWKMNVLCLWYFVCSLGLFAQYITNHANWRGGWQVFAVSLL